MDGRCFEGLELLMLVKVTRAKVQVGDHCKRAQIIDIIGRRFNYQSYVLTDVVP